MKYDIVSIKDEKTGCFHNPFYFANLDYARAEIRAVANTPETKLNKYPTDFTVYHLGSYDDTVGRFIPTETDTPELLFSVSELIVNIKNLSE